MADVKELRLVLAVPDFDAALQLYRDALGLEVEAVWESEGGHVVLLSAGRATLELVDEAHAAEIDRIEVGRRVAGPVRVAFRVDLAPGFWQRWLGRQSGLEVDIALAQARAAAPTEVTVRIGPFGCGR